MNRKVAAKRVNKPAAYLTAPNMILAGVGAVSLGRKQAKKSYVEAIERVIELRSQIEGEFKARKIKAKKQIAALQKKADSFTAQAEKEFKAQYKANLAPLQKQVEALVKKGEQKVLPAVKPVLVKFGVKLAPAAKPVRKTAKKAPVRRSKKVARRKR